MGATLYWLWKDDEDKTKRKLANRFLWGIKLIIILFVVSFAISFVLVLSMALLMDK